MKVWYARKLLAFSLTFCLSTSAVAQTPVLEEIIVTAQKRAQSIMDVPVAVTAFTGEQLKDLGIAEPTALGAFTAGLTTSMASATSAPVYSIRGVALDDVFANNSGGVQVYFDEVAPVSSAMQVFQLFDLERVEVLKGPQGTLYGRNATGGAISFFSHGPTEKPEATLDLDYDSLDVIKVTGTISGPLAPAIRGRLAGNVVESTGNGWQKGVNGSPGAAAPKLWALRSILEADLGSSTALRVTVHGGKDNSISSSWQASDAVGLSGLLFDIQLASPNEADRVDLGEFFSEVDGTSRPTNDTSSFGVTARIDVKVGLGTLTSISAYDSMNKVAYENYDGAPAALNDLLLRDDIDQFSQELRLSGERNGLDYILGGFVSHDIIKTDDATLATDVFNLVYGLDLFGLGTGPADTPEAYGAQVAVLTRSRQETDASGLFAHTEYGIAKDLRVTLAGRYSQEKRTFGGIVSDPSGFVTGVSGVLVDLEDTSRSQENWSGRVGLDYRASDRLLGYVSVSSGFKSGVFFSGPVTTPSGWGYADPETLVAYEGGFKASFAGGTAQLTGAAFLYDYNDKQLLGTIETPAGPIATLGNVPKSRVSGSELELSFQPVEGWDLRAGVSYLHATVVDAPTSIRGAPFLSPLTSGDPLSYAPKLSYFAVGRYSHALSSNVSGSVQGSFSHRDSMVTLLGDPFGVVGSSDQLGARIALHDVGDKWALALFGDNLANQKFRTYAYTNFIGNQSFALGRPRVVGLSLSFRN